MLTANAYQTLRSNGDLFVAASLVGCLLFQDWTIGIFVIFLFLTAIISRLWFITHSINKYQKYFFSSLIICYNLKIIYTFVIVLLTFFHSDSIGEFETPLKALLVAFIISLNIDRFRWNIFIYGASLGAIFSLALGIIQIEFEAIPRPGGATNPIRFGMIALTLALVCAVGLIRVRGNRILATLSLAGLLSGVAVALLSGSRGALIALPIALLFLIPLLWRRSRYAFVVVGLVLSVFVGGLLIGNVGWMSTRIGTAFTGVSSALSGEKVTGDRSVADRVKLLSLSATLFREHPLFGVGALGWNEATEKLAIAPDQNDRIFEAYNQAHNQYADDLAKGGAVRFLSSLLMMILPFYFFLKHKPFSSREGSEFALAGIVVTVSFIIFCLSESLMILSLPATIYTVLTFYLLAACAHKSEEEKADRVYEHHG
jgi:O-antigen ligase